MADRRRRQEETPTDPPTEGSCPGAKLPEEAPGVTRTFNSPDGAGSSAGPEVSDRDCPVPRVPGESGPFGDSVGVEEPPEGRPEKDGGSDGPWDAAEPCCPEAPAPGRPPPVAGAPKEPAGRRGSPRPGGEEEGWRKGASQSQLSDFSLLGPNWDSLQALGVSLPGGDAAHRRPLSYYGCCHKRALGRPSWATGLCLSGQWGPARDGGGRPGRPGKPWLPGHLKAAAAAAATTTGPPGAKPAPATGSPSPGPPPYLEDDGLPFPTDVVQHRLRQIEAAYKQEVEQLRRQVRELQLRLDIRHCCAPPAEPPVDYEDDFTCLKESDSSENEDFDHSEDGLSEASWEPVDKRETEVTRWVPDHMASHCFNCDCEFWLAKRRHHCRNCGNVFCAGCCHLKLPIPDQQLYDPVLVCNSCYDHIQVSCARELMSQHLKKPIATASS